MPGIWTSGGAGGGASSLTPTWEALSLESPFTAVGTPFAPTVQVALLGGCILCFRGLISTGVIGSGVWVATIPASFPAPAFTRRLTAQVSANNAVGLNLQADRKLVTSDATGNSFIALDGVVCVIP